jgi:hypothetical protein
MITVRVVSRLAEAIFLIGAMAYWAINNIGVPWPVGLLCGLLFFGTISAVRFLARYVRNRC